MKIIYPILCFFLFSAFNFCEQTEQYFSDINQSHEDLVSDYSQENSSRLLTSDEYKTKTEELFLQEVQSDIEDRHTLTESLNTCTPAKKGSALIVAFEGTGAYEPYIPALMERARLQYRDRVSQQDFDKTLKQVIEIVKAHKGKDPKWSGLVQGVMKALYKDASLLDGNFNWYSYPSEEAEVLAGLDSVNKRNLLSIFQDIRNLG